MRDDFDFGADEFEDVDPEEQYEEFLRGKRKRGDAFITTYDLYLDVMQELAPTTIHLLTWITFNAEMNTGKISMQSQNLSTCLKELGMAKSTFYKGIAELKEKDIVRGRSAKYYINPRYVWKGTNEMRTHFLRFYPRFK